MVPYEYREEACNTIWASGKISSLKNFLELNLQVYRKSYLSKVMWEDIGTEGMA